MSLKTILHLIIWPSLLVVGGVLVLTPRDILRQPILPPPTDAPRALLPAEEVAMIPATLTVRATALTPTTGVPVQPLTVASAEVAATPERITPASADRRWITARALNLRTGPTVGADLIASLPFGTAVEVIETSGSWARIEAGSVSGWLSANFLSSTDPGTNAD